MTEVPKNILMLKYNQGSKYGYLTDNELRELVEKVRQAWNLSFELDAGKAVELYYINLWYSLSNMMYARKLELPEL